MSITLAKRPYIGRYVNPRMVGRNNRPELLLTSEEAQRLVDAFPVIREAPNRIVLKLNSTHAKGEEWLVILPATLGGGKMVE